MDNFSYRIMAFAGICQACKLAQQIAKTGETDSEAFESLINSIVVTDPETPLDVYGSLQNLQVGLTEITHQLGNSRQKDAEITNYVVALLALERKLAKKSGKLAELGQRIDQIKRQVEHFSLLDEKVIENMAAVYREVISPLGGKIQVIGNPDVIKRESTQFKIRAVLLAGMRSAVLWRQLGGTRREILFKRKPVLLEASRLQKQL